jgi:hypothetical protein
MEFVVVTGNHGRTGDNLAARLTRLAELGPIVVFAEEQSIALEIPTFQLYIALGASENHSKIHFFN